MPNRYAGDMVGKQSFRPVQQHNKTACTVRSQELCRQLFFVRIMRLPMQDYCGDTLLQRFR